MPSCLFVLGRFFLRVDGVLFRLFDTRIFHSFGSSEVVRETRGKEASYSDVKRVRPPAYCYFDGLLNCSRGHRNYHRNDRTT